MRLKFSHIHHYVNDPTHMRDDSPMYVFDGSFGDKEGSQPLLKDYSVPEYFREDLFHHVGEKRRPPYRWWGKGEGGDSDAARSLRLTRFKPRGHQLRVDGDTVSTTLSTMQVKDLHLTVRSSRLHLVSTLGTHEAISL